MAVPTDAEKAAFRRRTGEEWDSTAPLDLPSPPSWTAPPPLPPQADDRQQATRQNSEIRNGPLFPDELKLPPRVIDYTHSDALVPGWNWNWGPPPESVVQAELSKRGLTINGSQLQALQDAQQRRRGEYDLGVDSLQGAERLTARLGKPPGYVKPYTREWDQWVLHLPQDSNDPAYNTALTAEQVAAADRERKRGNSDPNFDFPSAEKVALDHYSDTTTADEIRSLKQEAGKDRFLNQNRTEYQYDKNGELVRDRSGNPIQVVIGLGKNNTPIVVNAYGEEVDPRKVMQLTGGQKPGVSSASGGLADAQAGQDATGSAPGGVAIQGPVDVKTLMRSGKVVYTGSVTYKGAYGAEVTQAKFMSLDDANMLPVSEKWAPEQFAAFQKALKLKVTGYFDKETEAAWASMVNTANIYTTAGVPTDPKDVLGVAMQVGIRGATGGGSGGSGGGGGGGGGSASGGAAVSASQARAFLDQTMKQYAGRQANNAEAAAFYKDLNAAAMGSNFDPQSWAASWVNAHTGGQAGAYQAATTYYAAAMSALGGGGP